MDRLNKAYDDISFTEDIYEKYFNFLCKIIGVYKFDEQTPYEYLFKILFDTEFYSLVDHDENRIEDAKRLKDEFRLETNYISYDDLYDGCSIFEILISLAKSMNDSMLDLGIPYWFWIMISNLGLKDFKGILTPNEIKAVDIVLDCFVNRRYSQNGMLFPLNNPKEDQTKVELWYQMSYYFNENY